MRESNGSSGAETWRAFSEGNLLMELKTFSLDFLILCLLSLSAD